MDPSYLKYRFKKEFVNLLFCGLVAWKCHVCFFLCKKCKEVPMCHIYISIYLYTLGHTCLHSLCRPHILLICCTKTPEFSHLHSHCSTLKTTLNHAPKVWWFLQKPYHTNLCTPTISISITVTRIKILFWLFSCQYGLKLFTSKWRWQSYTKPYFF